MAKGPGRLERAQVRRDGTGRARPGSARLDPTRPDPTLTAAAAAVVPLQVKKAVEALLAFARSKAKGDALLLNESENVHLLVTVWKVPRVAQVIKM